MSRRFSFLRSISLLVVGTVLVEASFGADESSAREQTAEAEVATSETAAHYESLPLSTGFLFVDGEYWAPPYSVIQQNSEITIKTEHGIFRFQLPSEQSGNGNEKRRNGKGKSKDRDRQRMFEKVMLVEQALSRNGAVVGESDQEPALLNVIDGAQFLGWLLAEERESIAGEQSPVWLPDGNDATRWNQVFEHFEPSAELVTRAEPVIAAALFNYQNDLNTVQAQRLFDRSLYPLMSISLLLIAMAIGQLLGSHESLVKKPETVSVQSCTQDVIKCLALIAAFSLIDLVWTVLAVAAGEMHELNPLGRQLISDPFALGMAKALTTLLAAAILYRCRQEKIARQATWWICLVCMMVTVRWVFHSGLV